MNPALQSLLAKFDQTHLIQFVDELTAPQANRLREQIAAIDLEEIDQLFATLGKEDAWSELARRAEPPIALRLNDPAGNTIARDEAIRAGSEALATGTVGMIMVAGGLGSRLGFDHPKGMYPLGPVSGRTLFQIHIDKLKALNSRYGHTIPLYLMTSPATHLETEQFLDQHQWFGYPKEATRIFCQGTMPAVDRRTGRLILAEKDRLFDGPDGHGGMLASLQKSGCLDDMKSRDLSRVFYCQVDNPMCQICDAATIGYHIVAESEMSSQAIPKSDPLQRVGNIVSIDGKVRIIEYSDLPEDIARRTNEHGSPVLWAGNIAVHVFDVAFLDRMTGHADALPFHLALKKVPFLDQQGKIIEPDEPNAVRFERFIFDLLPLAEHSIVIEVDPQRAFSPVKNGPSESFSTPKTAQESMIAQARRVLTEAGIAIDENVAVEIDPHLEVDPNRLQQATEGISSIHEPTFLKL